MSVVKLLVLAPYLQNECGNYTTASRIWVYVKERWPCLLASVTDYNNVEDFSAWLLEHKITGIFAVHASHCAEFLLACNLPFVIILGGTDVNEKWRNQNEMLRALHSAQTVVSFNKSMEEKVRSLCPSIKRLKVISQAVTVPITSFDWKLYLLRNADIKFGHILLLCAGLRPVKDVLFLVDAFSRWHENNENVYLVIVGPKLDADYTELVASKTSRLKGVHLVHGLKRSLLLSAMAQSLCLINSSLSEGMSCAIMEAMALGVPVIARNIPGNCSLISDKHSGLLFDTPEEFIDCVQTILHNGATVKTLCHNAKTAIQEKHSAEVEKLKYVKILKYLEDLQS